MKIEKTIEKYKIDQEIDIEKIYNDFYNYVFIIATNLSKGYLNDEDIEEIISDTFFVLWKNTNKIKSDKPLKPYIAGISKNIIKEKLRKKKIHLDISDFENKIESTEKLNIDIEERTEIEEIKNIVDELTSIDRFIFEAYYYKSLKIKEISNTLHITEHNAKQRLYRIRKKIKKIIEKKGEM